MGELKQTKIELAHSIYQAGHTIPGTIEVSKALRATLLVDFDEILDFPSH